MPIDGEWDGIAPPQRGCFRTLAVPPVTKSRSSGTSVTSARTPSARGNSFMAGGSAKNKPNVETEEEKWDAAMSSKLISNSQRSKSVPPSSRRQRTKTVVYRDDPADKRNKVKSSVSTTSDDTDALLGGDKKLLRKKSDDDYGEWMDRPYSPPAKDEILWVHPSLQTNTHDSSGRLEKQTWATKQSKGNKKSQGDTSLELSSLGHASDKSKSSVFTAFSKWKSHSKNVSPSHIQNSNVHPTSISSSKSLDGSRGRRYGESEKNIRNPLRAELDQDNFDLADLLTTNLKQMEKDMEDIHRRKYSNQNHNRKALEDDYFRNKQLVHEQDEILEREQKHIPAEIALNVSGHDERQFHFQKDDGDTVSELGTESVTPKLNTSGLTLVYTDRAQRSNYLNDIDDTVQIKDDIPFSSYHRGVNQHFNNRGARMETAHGYKSRPTRSKSLTRFDNRGLPDISLVDSDSEYSARDIIGDDLSTPLHSKGLSLTEAFNDFGLDDRIRTSRRSRTMDEPTDRMGWYDRTINTDSARKSQIMDEPTERIGGYDRTINMNSARRSQIMDEPTERMGSFGQQIGRRMQNSYNNQTMDLSGVSGMDTIRTSGSSDRSVMNRILASRSLRSSKYVEAGGAVTLKRDQLHLLSGKRSDEPDIRHSSTKRGTLPKGSFPTNYDRPNQHVDSIDDHGGTFGGRPSRRMIRSLQTN